MVNKRNSIIQPKKKSTSKCACKPKAVKTKAVTVKSKLKMKAIEAKK